MKIEIVIPNFNGYDLIKQNLSKVIEVCSREKNISISIVDDGSKSEEQRLLSEYIDEVKKTSKVNIKLELNSKNVGFSSNVNRVAMVSKSEILVLLNTDVAPEKGFLDPLIKHFSDEKVFGVGCLDKSIEDGKTVLRGRGMAKWKRGFLVHRRGEVNMTDTFWVSGGSCALRTEVFQKLGGFDPLYNPFYWEDIDLSYRAQKAGYKVIFEPKSIVTHKHFKGSIKKHYKDNVIKSYAMRNQFTFVWKNITDKNLIISNILCLPYYILRAVLRFDEVFLKGFYLAIIRLPVIMKRRKIQKTKYVLTDKDILKSQEHS